MNKKNFIDLGETDILIIDGDRGNNYPSKNDFYQEGFCLFLDATNITKNGFNFSDRHFITKEKDKKLKKGKLKRNDIVMMTRGSVGDVAIYDESVPYDNIRINSGMVIFRCQKDYDAKLLYYMLKSPFIEKQINDLMSGTVQKQLPVLLIKQLKLLKFNKNINIDLISFIDEKVKINNNIKFKLENFEKIIYNYWFLQFEFPNTDGKPYKSCGGKMVWCKELKKNIPEGWMIESLFCNSLCKIVKPGVEKFEIKNYLATSNVNGSNINDGEWVTYANRETRANMQPCLNSVWFAKMKNSIKHITLSNYAQWFVDKYILSTGFLGLKCNNNCLSYIHCMIENDRFEIVKNILSHGATQEAINNEDLKSIKVLVPNKDILQNFEKKVYKFIQKENAILKENDELISIRNFLLPLLMNGKIRIK